MNRTELIGILEGDLKDAWSDYYDWVKEKTDLKTEEKRAEVATTLFIQHCRILERLNLFDFSTTAAGFQTGKAIQEGKSTESKTSPQVDSGPELSPIFGTDDKGKVWTRTVVCLGKGSDGKICGGVATAQKSKKNPGIIYAICPKCDHFVNNDGTRGNKVERGGKS